MDLGARIKYARSKAGLSQLQLAHAVGVTKGAVSQWEGGNTKNLKMENLFAVADATGFSAKWLGISEGPERTATTVPLTPDEIMDRARALSPEQLAILLRAAADKLGA